MHRNEQKKVEDELIDFLIARNRKGWESFNWEPFLSALDSFKISQDGLFEPVLLGQVELVGFGENHDDVLIHRFFSNLVLDLPQYGIKTICLELASDLKNEIHQYYSTADEIFLKKIWEWEKEMISMDYPIAGRYKTPAYPNIIRNARRAGLEVVPIDITRRSRRRRQTNGRPERRRENVMVQNTALAVKPAVVYVGSLHLSKMGGTALGAQFGKQLGSRFVTVAVWNTKHPQGFIQESFSRASGTVDKPFFLDLRRGDVKSFFEKAPTEPEFIEFRFDVLLVI